jgi:hypothetical protein
MRRDLWLLAFGLSAASIHAQNCPALNFVQGSAATVFDSTGGSGLQRQADGSFTRQRYKVQPPYAKVDSTANFQSAFLNCSAAGTRTFKNLPGWVPLADRPGQPSQGALFSDFLGNGAPVGLGVVPGGTVAGQPLDTLVVEVFSANGTAQTPVYYPVIQNVSGLLVGDFNHDGKKDIVVVSYGTSSSPNTITVFLGKGDGTLQPGVSYPSGPSGAGAFSAVALDFNGDNNLDLAVAGAGYVSFLAGHGDGAFAAPVSYPAAQAYSLAQGDFNGDGKADLVLGGSQNLSVFLGNGDGTFRAAVSLPETFNASYIVAGDFNKDGKLDLAVTDTNGGILSILLGDGTGKFSGEYDYIAGYEPQSLFAMDLDGDGNLDVVLGTGHPDVLVSSPYSDTVTAFFGRGDGTLVGPPAYHVGSNLNSMVLADFNGDGKPDVAVAATQLWVLMSRGGGAFNTPVSIAIPSSGNSVTVSSVAAGDFNGDGKQDLVVGDSNGSGVYVLLGNGDGTFQTPVRYAMGGDVNSVALADFNGDGKLDIAACGDGFNAPSGSTAGVLLGNGNGTFQSVKTLSGFGNGPHWLAVGDFNKDGKPDLAIANRGIPGGADMGGRPWSSLAWATAPSKRPPVIQPASTPLS